MKWAVARNSAVNSNKHVATERELSTTRELLENKFYLTPRSKVTIVSIFD